MSPRLPWVGSVRVETLETDRGVRLLAQVAETRRERARGLLGRTSLDRTRRCCCGGPARSTRSGCGSDSRSPSSTTGFASSRSWPPAPAWCSCLVAERGTCSRRTRRSTYGRETASRVARGSRDRSSVADRPITSMAETVPALYFRGCPRVGALVRPGPPSSSGLRFRPFKAATRVRIPLGARNRIEHAAVEESGVLIALSRRRCPGSKPVSRARPGSSDGRARG